MSFLEAGKWMCMAAIAEATYAACVLPAAWPTVAAIGLAYSDPGQMDNAGTDWKATAHQLEQVGTQLDRLAKSVPADKWQEGGRDKFQAALDKYHEALKQVHQFTDDVGGMLTIAGYAFFAFAVLAFTIATLLAVYATALLATSWTIVGAAAMMAAGNTVAGICDGIISACCVSLKTALMVIVGIIGAGMGVYMYSQYKASSPTGSGPVNFQQATIMPTTPNVQMPPTY